MSKKATEVAFSAVEGVSEAIDEHGERVSEKTVDAFGSVAVGVAKSIDKLLDEHATDVAAAAGRTLVQSFEGFENGIATEYYDKIENVSIVAPDDMAASVEFMGRISDEPVIDAYLIVNSVGNFGIDFTFAGADGAELMKKSAEAVTDGVDKYTVVSFALTEDELAKWAETGSVKIEITPKQTV
jgi:hypothetical protein